MLETISELEYSQPISSSRRDVSELPEALQKIVTSHPEMRKLFNVVEKVSRTDSTVLILGESGTGKELIARAIHDLSDSKGHFVPVNCGAIPDNLLESELFGHEKGSFTGATQSKPGRFLLADCGTIFLDEIGEMSPHLQVKLLRVLQDKVIEPVGSTRSRKVNVRVVAATNVNLREQVEQKKFRDDLFYRLQVVPIELPALKRRKEDIPLLINYFSKQVAERNSSKPIVFSDDALKHLIQYEWPGNVRELENLVERLAILAESNAVYATDLPPAITNGQSGSAMLSGPDLPEEGIDFNSAVESFENSLIMQALIRTEWNKKAAAELLNLNRTTLVEKIKKKGLEQTSGDANDA